jgi:hypothetical protein
MGLASPAAVKKVEELGLLVFFGLFVNPDWNAT